MKCLLLNLTGTAILSIILTARTSVAAPPADVSGEYQITDSARPDGAGAYRGKVLVETAGPSCKMAWTLTSGETYSGPAIFQAGVLGAGYGEGLTGLALYEIKGRILKAKWLLPAAPGQVGEYELTGPATLNGAFKFTNGAPGGVTFTPNGKIYDVLWNLPTGSFGGIAVRVGDVLVAVSGKPGSNFGVAAYRAAGNRLNGVWAVPNQTGLGMEILASSTGPSTNPMSVETASAPGNGDSAAGFSPTGTDVRFAGETYHLQDSVSKPGAPTSELREYLRAGETFDNYAKMVALRLQNPNGSSPLAYTQALLKQVKKDYPGAESREIEHSDAASTVEFLLLAGDQVEYNFWHYFRTPKGIASVQFVLRNHAPFDSKEKFKAEQAAHLDAWLRDAKALAPQVAAALVKTVRPTGAESPAEGAGAVPAGTATAKKADAQDDALNEKIAADLRTAGGIAGNFLGLLKENKLDEAAALVADEGLTRMGTTRKDFVAKLRRDQQSSGRVITFTPDKDKLDFGAEAGGVYFVLNADSKCEKGSARETLRFLRFPDGKVRLVGYERAGQASPGK